MKIILSQILVSPCNCRERKLACEKMSKVNKCCNPLNKSSHRNVHNNLLIVSEKWDVKFKSFVGKFVCASCKSRMSRTPLGCISFDENNSKESDSVDDGKDPEFKIIEPRPKKMRPTEEIDSTEMFPQELKTALSLAHSRSDKIALLATIPLKWSVYRMSNEFNVARSMAAKAKKVHIEYGYGGRPEPKNVRKIEANILENIKQFYLSEENCRVLPGRKDFVSFVMNDIRVHKQKRLLYCNVNELYEKFKNEFPHIKVSLSKFAQCRPKECIQAGKSGTHNVCVCKIHENMRLKCLAVRDALSKNGVKYNTKYSEYLKEMTCSEATVDCFFSKCENCPGAKEMYRKLKQVLDSGAVSKIIFKQWSSTDR